MSQRAALAFGLVVLAGVATACGSPTLTEVIRASSPAAPTIDVPVAAAVQVPKGNKLVGKYKATGVQTYTCTGNTWKGLEPSATLVDGTGKPVMLHSRGPIWVSTVDGSAVEAAPVDGAKVERAGAVPELLLKSKSTRGDGVLGAVSWVQRLDTEGGVAPGGRCSQGSQTSVPYSALYTFYASEE